LRPEIWAKQVWNIGRNNGIFDEKKFLSIVPCNIRISDNQYI